MRSIPSGVVGFAALALLVFATACQQIPPAPLSAEDGARRIEARSLADPALGTCLEERFGRPTNPWPPTRWSLEDLTRVAICFNPTLAVARATADVARAHERTVAQLPNPIFMVQPFYVANGVASGAAPWFSQFNLSGLIETAGKRAHRRAAAEAGARMAEAGTITAAWTIRGQVSQAAIALRAAAGRSASHARIAALLRRRAELLAHRVEQGYAARSEVAVARRDLLQAESQSATARRLESQARANLATTLGLPSEALVGVSLADELDQDLADELADDLDRPIGGEVGDGSAGGGAGPPEAWTRAATLDAATARHVALIGRADVRAALADYDAAEANLRLQLAQQYPNITFGPAYKYDKSQNDYGLALSVELPLFSRNAGGIAEAAATRDLVAARFDALQTRILSEVDTAAEALETARQEALRARALVAAAEQADTIAARQLDAGALDRATYLTTRLASARVAVAAIDAREALQLAIARLELAVQPPGPIADLLAAGDRG
ncbi:MAG: TolC family protein [Myxococcota bacterium]